MRAKCPACLIFFIICDGEHKLWSFSSRNFLHLLATSSLTSKCYEFIWSTKHHKSDVLPEAEWRLVHVHHVTPVSLHVLKHVPLFLLFFFFPISHLPLSYLSIRSSLFCFCILISLCLSGLNSFSYFSINFLSCLSFIHHIHVLISFPFHSSLFFL